VMWEYSWVDPFVVLFWWGVL